MGKYANQKIIKITQIPKKMNELRAMHDNNFFFCGQEALNIACMLSVKNGNKLYLPLWLYLAKNQPNYSFGFSPHHLLEKVGGSLNTAKKAFEGLIEDGYLKGNGNSYQFYILPNGANNVEEAMEYVNSKIG